MTQEAADRTRELREREHALCFTQDSLSYRQPPFPI